jgi:hypothetical protein
VLCEKRGKFAKMMFAVGLTGNRIW